MENIHKHMYDKTKHEALVNLLQAVKNTDYSFTTITPCSHAVVNARPENQWAKNAESAIAINASYPRHRILREIFGWSRPFYQIDIEPEIFDLMRQAGVLKPFDNGWLSAVRISTIQDSPYGKLLFLHSAFPTIEAESVFFGPDTYRYLHEIQHQISSTNNTVERAIDIGVGAGCGAIYMALQYPVAEVYAVDINQRALEMTAVNAEVAAVNNVKPVLSDLLTGVDGSFDLITANPPYLVDKEKRAYRHGGGDFGASLAYEIVRQSLPRLTPGGSLLLYTGVAIIDGVDIFKDTVQAYLQSLPNSQFLNWTYREIDPDIFGEELSNPCYSSADRIAAVILKITKSI